MGMVTGRLAQAPAACPVHRHGSRSVTTPNGHWSAPRMSYLSSLSPVLGRGGFPCWTCVGCDGVHCRRVFQGTTQKPPAVLWTWSDQLGVRCVATLVGQGSMGGHPTHLAPHSQPGVCGVLTVRGRLHPSVAPHFLLLRKIHREPVSFGNQHRQARGWGSRLPSASTQVGAPGFLSGSCAF